MSQKVELIVQIVREGQALFINGLTCGVGKQALVAKFKGDERSPEAHPILSKKLRLDSVKIVNVNNKRVSLNVDEVLNYFCPVKEKFHYYRQYDLPTPLMFYSNYRAEIDALKDKIEELAPFSSATSSTSNHSEQPLNQLALQSQLSTDQTLRSLLSSLPPNLSFFSGEQLANHLQQPICVSSLAQQLQAIQQPPNAAHAFAQQLQSIQPPPNPANAFAQQLQAIQPPPNAANPFAQQLQAIQPPPNGFTALGEQQLEKYPPPKLIDLETENSLLKSHNIAECHLENCPDLKPTLTDLLQYSSKFSSQQQTQIGPAQTGNQNLSAAPNQQAQTSNTRPSSLHCDSAWDFLLNQPYQQQPQVNSAQNGQSDLATSNQPRQVNSKQTGQSGQITSNQNVKPNEHHDEQEQEEWLKKMRQRSGQVFNNPWSDDDQSKSENSSTSSSFKAAFRPATNLDQRLRLDASGATGSSGLGWVDYNGNYNLKMSNTANQTIPTDSYLRVSSRCISPSFSLTQSNCYF